MLNNEAEYKALIVGLRLAKELQARSIQIYSDSQLVINLVNDIYLGQGDRMATYVENAKGLIEPSSSPLFRLSYNPRMQMSMHWKNQL